ncbi:MAG: hypothetical protein LBI29_02605 [Rickettsiales bacterium]|jgi:hypothetical protein|nr:hypothetical protein [Rickettsiales bacterium]
MKVKYLGIAVVVFLIQSCTAAKVVDVKSPCVSGKNGPCGPKRPINDWWLNGLKLESKDLG